MTTPSTDTHSSMVACPPLEDIAAFLDGINLSPEERARITEHLAHCESCYEIFAGAVHFQEEEGNSSADDIDGGDVLKFPLAKEKSQEKHVRVEPARPPRRFSRWLPLAASVVLAVGLGALAWQFFAVPREMDLAELTEPLQQKPELIGSLYEGDTYRGNEDFENFPPEDAKVFLASVYLVDLHLNIEADDPELAAEALRRIGTEIEQIPLLGDEGKKYQNEALNLESSEGLRRFSQRLSDEEGNIRELLSPYEPFYSFGLWTEAGRRAAVTHTREFFEARKNRRFLSHLRKTLPSQLAPELRDPVQKDLQAIESTWDEGDFSRQDYTTLAAHFQKIIERIDEYKEDLLGDG